MTVTTLNQRMYELAVELRRLAYTMPGGHEDPLLELSERMIRCACNAAEQPLNSGPGRHGAIGKLASDPWSLGESNP